MMRAMLCGVVVVGALAPLSAQQARTAVKAPPPDGPQRLMAVQELAFAAYPELRTAGLQLRVESTPTSETVTFGFASADRDTVLAVSRPRAAELVVEAHFDGQDRLTRATLRGTLAHSKERREAHGRGAGVGRALEEDGAAFPPSKRAAFLQQMDTQVAKGLAGTLAAADATFTQGTAEDGLYWEVAATSASGESVTLGFEPYAGRLVKFSRGGGQ